jgi:hypothetical protein
LDFFVDAMELPLNALDLILRRFRLVVIHLGGGCARQSPLRAIDDRHHHFQIAQQFGSRPGGNLLLRLSLRFEEQLGIVQYAFADSGRTFAPRSIQLARLSRIAAMLG